MLDPERELGLGTGLRNPGFAHTTRGLTASIFATPGPAQDPCFFRGLGFLGIYIYIYILCGSDYDTSFCFTNPKLGELPCPSLDKPGYGMATLEAIVGA